VFTFFEALWSSSERPARKRKRKRRKAPRRSGKAVTPVVKECPYPPEQLDAKLLARDAPAWNWLFGRYSPLIYAVAIKKLREDEAREVVQKVFVEFVRVLESGARIEFLGGFLHKVAVRRTLDVLKKRMTDESRQSSMDAGSDADDRGPQYADESAESPPDQVAGDERVVLVQRLTAECLDGLSPPERRAAELLVQRMRGEIELSWAEIREKVKGEYRKTINLARVFEKFRAAFARSWDKL